MRPSIPIAVVTVAHNSADVLPRSLGSAQDAAELVVVDNASTDASATVARAHGATVLASGANLGFGPANNRGAAATSSPLVLFLNPDAELTPGALGLLADRLMASERWAAVNPRILGADGTPFFRSATRLAGTSSAPRDVRPPDADADVESLSGAAFAVKRAAFDAVGGFDEMIFLYFEDDDLSVRLLRAGFGLGYVHDAAVVHTADRSTRPAPGLIEFKAYHYMRSMRYAFTKHEIPFHTSRRLAFCRWRRLLARLAGKPAEAARYAGYVRALSEPLHRAAN